LGEYLQLTNTIYTFTHKQKKVDHIEPAITVKETIRVKCSKHSHVRFSIDVKPC